MVTYTTLFAAIRIHEEAFVSCVQTGVSIVLHSMEDQVSEMNWANMSMKVEIEESLAA